MRKLSLLLGLTVLVVGLAGPSDAITKSPRLPPAHPLVFLDPASDANFLTTEDVGHGVPAVTQPTPVQRADADILGVRFSRLVVAGKVKGFELRLTLAAPPGPVVDYGLYTSTPECPSIQLHYYSDAARGTGSPLFVYCGQNVPAFPSTDPPVRIEGNAIVWTVLLTNMPSPVKIGSRILAPAIETRNDAGLVVDPAYDHAGTDKYYVIGS